MPDDEERVQREPSGVGAPWLMVLAGLLGACLAASGVHLQRYRSPGKVCAIAILWIIITTLIGTAAMGIARILLRPRSPRPFRLDALETAAAWLMLPPLSLLAAWNSPWTLAFASGVAAVLAASLRGMIPVAQPEEDPPGPSPHFAQLPAPDSNPAQAFAVAVSLECAAVLAYRREVLLASLLMAFAAFLFVWKRLTMLLWARGRTMAAPMARSAATAVLALLVIIPMLLVTLVRMGPITAGGAVAQAAARRRDAGDEQSVRDAYRGIVLFTVPKKNIELPVPVPPNPLRSGNREPLVIPFNGAYWYFQAPHQGPGLHPHVAHGDPVKVSIYATGWLPLVMQAHQALPRPVDLRGSEAMRVTLRNGDNRAGRIDLGVLLTDSTLPGKPSFFLGTEPILSTEAGHFAFKPEPVEEVVTFAISHHARLRRFDEITVFFFPSGERSALGARVGIEQFAMQP